MVEKKEKVSVVVPEVVVAKKPTKKESFFQKNKKLVLLAGGVLVILVLLYVFLVFLPNWYRFSYKLNSLDYYSNEYTPSEFFSLIKEGSSFVVSVDLIDGNADPWNVNSLNLWLIALNADGKKAVSLVKTVDAFGNISSCITNDANVLSSRELNKEECTLLLDDSSSIKINIHKGPQNKVIFFTNSAEVYAQRGQSEALVNYSFIKQVYPNFDDTLAIINERINSVN